MPPTNTSLPIQPQPRSFTCTFCGLLCDDLKLSAGADGQLQADKSCARLEKELALSSSSGTPRIQGKPSTTAEAIQEAVAILRAARQPIIGGLGTDVAGTRNAIALADKLGAVLEHGMSESLFRNILPLQVRGAFNATFGELRNRADLVLYVGTDAGKWPRFAERFIDIGKTVSGIDGAKRKQYFLGHKLKPRPGTTNTALKIRPEALTDALGAIKRLYLGDKGDVGKIGGLSRQALQDLVETIKKAQYICVVWAASDLNKADADLTVEAILDLIRAISVTQRCTGIPLGGDAGSTTATNVMTWQTGYPGRVSFASTQPDYQPQSFASERLLSQGEADVLLWVNAYPNVMKAPAGDAQIIALCPPGTRWRRKPGVEIPIGIPGLHHAGHAFRADSVVSLPLTGQVSSELPSAADALQSILEQLGGKA